ncbi:MAG: hypothetical protein ACXVGH_04700 [Mycobacteriales bacterium]
MLVVGGVLAGLVGVLLAVVVGRWVAARAVEPDLGPSADGADGEAVRALPAGHRPPPGLSPLSPSERFLAAEASRGLRELQLFLLDAA